MPRIEFKLSFDNYLDVYGRTPEKTRPRFLRALLGVALLLIFVGFLLAHQDRQSDSIAPPGALAATVGLCLFVFCLPLWFFIYKPNANARLKSSRENYEQYFTEPRVIEFDDSSWKYCYGESTNSGPWSALRSFAKVGNTLVLADAFVQYFIPADVFSEEQRALFSTYCERAHSPEPKLFSVQLSLHAASYLRARMANRWIRRPTRMASLYTLGLLFSVVVAYIFAEAISVKAWPIAAGIVLVLIWRDLFRA